MSKSFLFVFMFCMPFIWAQHKISAVFTPAENFEIAILYKISTQNLSYVTYAKFNEEGQLSMSLDSTLTKGMYRLVYAMPHEEYNFDLIYNTNEDIEFKFNQEKGLEFTNSQENRLIEQYRKTMAAIDYKIAAAYRKQPLDSTLLRQLFETQNTKQSEYEIQSKYLVVHEFIRANRRYIPSSYEPLKKYESNIKKHHFDVVDFNNPILLSSTFLIDHAVEYVFGLTGTSLLTPELVEENVMTLNQKLKSAATPQIRYDIFKVIHQQMLEVNYEPLALDISKQILMPLAITLNDYEGIQAMHDFERTAIGSLAPNFEIEEKNSTTKAKTLHDLEGKTTYMLVIWTSSCGHCIDELPQIHKIVSDHQTNDKSIIAIGLEENPYKWNNMKYEMTAFTHVLALGKWEHPLVQLYNITTTPFYMVLDKEKNIIAKPESLEDLLPFIQK